QRVPTQVHVRGVRLGDRQAERIGGIGARGQDERQALAQRRGGGRVGDQFVDRTAAEQQARLFDTRAGDVAGVGADDQHEGYTGGRRGDRDRENPLDQAPPARARPLGQG